MSNPAGQISDDSLTLFTLITAMLIYRTIDLFTVKQKLEQLSLRVPWFSQSPGAYPTLKHACRAYPLEARSLVPNLRLLMFVRAEFTAFLMSIYLVLFTVTGFSFLLSPNGRLGGKTGAVVAIITATVSFASSIINLFIERVRLKIG